MGLINELKKVVYGLPTKTGRSRRDKIAHFCEHRGICIEFTPAKATWRAIVPSTIRPWWLELNTLKIACKTEMSDSNTAQTLENA